MRIVFFGSPSAALPSLEAVLGAGHEVRLVVTQPDKPAGRGRKTTPSAVKVLALERGLPVIEPARIRGDESALDLIRAAGPEINVVVAYGQIIPRSVHALPPYRSVNVHFSLLPKYRGAAPVQWTVLNADTESGVTVIELNDRMDEGDILAQERVPVEPRETARSLESRLAARGAGLLVATLARIDTVPRIRQDDARATLAPKIRKEDGLLAWTDPAGTIDRQVLALADRPGVFTHFKGKRVNILRGRPAAADGNGASGTILDAGKAGLIVACGENTAYLVEELQPEGRGVMSAHAFSLGARIAPGDRFGP